MIAIEHVLLSDEVVTQQFVCDLQSCKGGCCVEGDCGAPLTEEETGIIKKVYPLVKKYLSAQAIHEIKKQGTHTVDSEFGYVTPTIDGGVCVYAYKDEQNIIKCGIEKAWKKGIIDFQKPLSCHLFPIRIKESEGYEMVNYQPRKKLCNPACKLGSRLKIPVYKFLEQALKRKYGDEFFETLEAVAKKINNE